MTMPTTTHNVRCADCGCMHCDLSDDGEWLCDTCEEARYMGSVGAGWYDGPTIEEDDEDEDHCPACKGTGSSFDRLCPCSWCGGLGYMD